MKKHYGNTAFEYVLIGGLILVFLVSFFTLIGTNFDTKLHDLKTNLMSSIDDAKSFKKEKDKAVAEQAAGLQSIAKNQTKICTKDLCVNVPADTAAAVMTAGGLGDKNNLTFGQFGWVIANVAAVMDSDDTDAAIKKIVTELANAGHSVSNAEKTLSILCSSTKTCDNGVNTIVPVSALDAMAVKNNYEIQQKTHEFWENKQILDAFRGNSAIAQVVLPPEKQVVIDTKAVEIITTAQSKGLEAVDNIKNGVNSVIVKNDSNTICTTGGQPPACLQ